MTYRELNDESDRVAVALLARGLRHGQPVSLYAQNRWEWVVAYHGALKAGAVVNPVNVMLTPAELAFVLRDCGAAAVFTSAEQAADVVAVTREMAEPVTVVAFGAPRHGRCGVRGTPGRGRASARPRRRPGVSEHHRLHLRNDRPPKGAVQSHRAVLLNCALTATMHGRTRDDVVVTALPAPHVYGNVVINGTFLAAAR